MEPKSIKTIQLEPGIPFIANGKTYIPSESFSIGRFERVEELENELITFSDKKTAHDVMLKAMQHINSYEPGLAYTLLYNKIDSDQRNAKLNHYALRLCCAYINFEGEDSRYLTEETIKAKIHDWSEEGLDVAPFLLFVVRVCRALFERYKSPMLSILQQTKEIRESLSDILDMKSLTEVSGLAQP